MKIHPILRLIEEMKREPKPLLGAEVERLGKDGEGNILQYSSHILPLLEELHQKNSWEVLHEEDGKLLALQKEKDAITLEPGAQFEISPAPSSNLFDLCRREKEISDEVLSTSRASAWKWIWTAVNPQMKADEVELIPSPRYQIMTKYFPNVGKRGLEMMRLTAGSHLNLDFFDGSEAIRMLQASAYLSPLVGAVLANSPFYQGRTHERLSVRSLIWEQTDPVRSGLPKEFFHSDFNLSGYVNLVESVPLMYYLNEEGDYIAANGRALKELSETLQSKNALSAMRQLFTDVRIKPCCVEFRAMDQQEPEMRIAGFALATGILYDEENAKWAAERAIRVGYEKTKQRQTEASISGLKNQDLYQELKECFERSNMGLQRRGFSEEGLLAPLEKLIQSRTTPAELALKAMD